MGLLDDAIREHLELKRRHGASTEEVDRQEREVLGEARRAETEAEPLEPTEPPAAPFDAAAEEPEAPQEPEDPWLEAARDEVPAEEALDRPPAEEALDRPQADEAADRPPPAEDAGEDVLEETPEFLQETPEHERLWFEQRPPRDFDWDK
jgi:hypothetical protein